MIPADSMMGAEGSTMVAGDFDLPDSHQNCANNENDVSIEDALFLT